MSEGKFSIGFQVGQRVRVSVDPYRGQIGTVVDIRENYMHPHATHVVHLDFGRQGPNDQVHYGAYYRPNELTLVTDGSHTFIPDKEAIGLLIPKR